MEEQLDELERVVESLQKKGVIRRNIHPRLLAGTFIGDYFTAVFLNEFLGPELYNTESAMETTRHFLGMEWRDFPLDILSRWTGRTGFQVLQEFYATVPQKPVPGPDQETAREDVRSLLSRGPTTVDRRVVEGAL
jgi:hypothetical protein